MDFLFWDSIIILFLILDAWTIYWLATKAKQRFSKTVVSVCLTLCSLAWAVIFYGSFIEPKMVVTHQQTLTYGDGSQGTIRLAIVSDLHLGPYHDGTFVDLMTQRIDEQQPDAVLLLGDFIYLKSRDIKDLKQLKALTEKYPTYAVMGNHDYHLYSDEAPVDYELGSKVEEAIASVGVEVLKNRGLRIENTPVWLSGLQELWTKNVSVDKALQNRPNGTPLTIVIAHNPDSIEKIKPDQHIDLMLSGHTHGGQIRLPLIGAVPSLPTKLGKSYDRGLFDFEQTKLFITSGIGESGPRARLFNKPEIVIMTIKY